jgi:hypothetical protein
MVRNKMSAYEAAAAGKCGVATVWAVVHSNILKPWDLVVDFSSSEAVHVGKCKA